MVTACSHSWVRGAVAPEPGNDSPVAEFGCSRCAVVGDTCADCGGAGPCLTCNGSGAVVMGQQPVPYVELLAEVDRLRALCGEAAPFIDTTTEARLHLRDSLLAAAPARCHCGDGPHASLEGPLRDCPVHGERAGG